MITVITIIIIIVNFYYNNYNSIIIIQTLKKSTHRTKTNICRSINVMEEIEDGIVKRKVEIVSRSKNELKFQNISNPSKFLILH